MDKVIFIIMCWVFIVLNFYYAHSAIQKITDFNLKMLANVIFFLFSALVIVIAFIAEYLKK